MNRNYQYSFDNERLAALIERHTSIPKERVSEFVAEYGIGEMLPCANVLCRTEQQREKLTALFEFKNLYETIKSGEANKKYRISSTNDAQEYFINYYADVKDKEYVVAAYLTTNMDVIVTKPISTGTLNQALVNHREIIKEALFCNAGSIVIAHNHPSGSLTISRDDIDATQKLYDATYAAGVKLADHIIVAGDQALSLADHGHVPVQQKQASYTREAASLSDKTSKYITKPKPLRIMEQLEIAQKHRSFNAVTSRPHKNNHSKEER